MQKKQSETAELLRGVSNFILAVLAVLAFATFDAISFFICLMVITAINFTILKPRISKLIGQSNDPVPDFNLLPSKYTNREQ
ncbi:MAG: hypothetical protein GY765_34340 [bacterium]|nr:hypothetical protein [bacterium]